MQHQVIAAIVVCNTQSIERLPFLQVSPIPFEPATLAFENVGYSVTCGGQTKDLLSGVSGYVAPGTMVALMGSSGAQVFMTGINRMSSAWLILLKGRGDDCDVSPV
jgi:hypothetical protein